jgi:hypothetical protein
MADLKTELETWTDEVEGNLEKRKICGVPLTRKVTLPILILFLMSIFIIGVVFGAKEGKPKSGGSSGVDSTGTLTNTHTIRYEQALAIIEPLVGTVLNDQTSPQHQALDWLANVDPAELNFEDIDLDEVLQRYVLVVIYFATGGERWDYDYNFLSLYSVCEWNMQIETKVWGASCFDGVHVNNLYLEDNNLEGTIPRDIGLIPKLEYLGMKGNNLHGILPTTLGMLTNLIKIDVSKYDICEDWECHRSRKITVLICYFAARRFQLHHWRDSA